MKLDKVEALKAGKFIVSNDEELDELFRNDPDTSGKIRSVHNPVRVGVKDQYITWIGDYMTDDEVLQKMRAEGWYK